MPARRKTFDRFDCGALPCPCRFFPTGRHRIFRLRRSRRRRMLCARPTCCAEDAGVSTMERTLIAVEPDGPHWQVTIDHYALARHVERGVAIARAKEMARDCHESIGMPTGVRLRMRCGDKVLVDACG